MEIFPISYKCMCVLCMYVTVTDLAFLLMSHLFMEIYGLGLQPYLLLVYV